VIGYGDVGKGSAASLRQEDVIVKITEIDPICAMQACMDGFEVVPPYLDGVNTGDISCMNTLLMGTTDIIVTTTGNTSVCDEKILKTIKNGAVVFDIGHFDKEIDTAFMRKTWTFEEVRPQVHKV
jgi:adenosylhomocysteinase